MMLGNRNIALTAIESKRGHSMRDGWAAWLMDTIDAAKADWPEAMYPKRSF